MCDTHSLRIGSTIAATPAEVFVARITAETLDARPSRKYRTVMQGEEDPPIAVGEYRLLWPTRNWCLLGAGKACHASQFWSLSLSWTLLVEPKLY
jgi:hypothetical protein